VDGPAAPAAKRKRVQKEKAPRDPNAPKRPSNAYFLFTQDERERIAREHPAMTRTEITKEMSVRWKELPADEKKVGRFDS
jgi:hypothetical protein